MAINWNHKTLINLKEIGRFTDPAFKALHYAYRNKLILFDI